eukprot:1193004-Prorocentrum_minimum.AAC.1
MLSTAAKNHGVQSHGQPLILTSDDGLYGCDDDSRCSPSPSWRSRARGCWQRWSIATTPRGIFLAASWRRSCTARTACLRCILRALYLRSVRISVLSTLKWIDTLYNNNFTSFYGSSCADNGKDALNTPEFSPRESNSRRRNMPPPLTRLALVGGICHPPSRDWLSSEEYATPPHAIGSRRRNIPHPLTRLAL